MFWCMFWCVDKLKTGQIFPVDAIPGDMSIWT